MKKAASRLHVWLRQWWPEALVLLLALSLRLVQLGSRDMWFDEAIEYHVSRANLGLLSERLQIALQPPLFNLVLHGWLLGGRSLIWLRLLSVGFSLGAVAGTMAWLRSGAQRRVALLAGLGMACMPGEIRYAQDISEYALLACWLPWTLLALQRAWQYNTWPRWLVWAALASAAVATHYGALLVLVPAAAVSLAGGGRRRQWQASLRLALSSLLPLAVLAGLYAWLLQSQLAKTARSIQPWQGLLAEAATQLKAFPQALGFQLNGAPYNVISITMLGMLLVCVALIILTRWIEGQLGAGERRMLLWSAGIWVAYALAVRSGHYAYGLAGQRYALILTPCLALVLGLSLDSLWSWHSLAGALGLVCLTLVQLSGAPQPEPSVALRGHRAWPEEEYLHSVLQQWQVARSASDLTLVHLGAAPAFTYYAAHDPGLGLDCFEEDTFYPAAAGARECPQVWLAPYLRNSDKAADLRAFTGPLPDSWWLIVSHDPRREGQQITDGMTGEFAVERVLSAPGAAAYHLVRQAP